MGVFQRWSWSSSALESAREIFMTQSIPRDRRPRKTKSASARLLGDDLDYLQPRVGPGWRVFSDHVKANSDLVGVHLTIYAKGLRRPFLFHLVDPRRDFFSRRFLSVGAVKMDVVNKSLIVYRVTELKARRAGEFILVKDAAIEFDQLG